MAEPIVQLPLFIVREDGVGFRAFLELVLGRLVARIAVRVELHREPAIRALDFRFAGAARHAEDFVVIPLAHAFATFTMACRSNRSPIM